MTTGVDQQIVVPVMSKYSRPRVELLAGGIIISLGALVQTVYNLFSR